MRRPSRLQYILQSSQSFYCEDYASYLLGMLVCLQLSSFQGFPQKQVKGIPCLTGLPVAAEHGSTGYSYHWVSACLRSKPATQGKWKELRILIRAKWKGGYRGFLYIQPPKLGVLRDLCSQLPPSEASVNMAQGLILHYTFFISCNAFVVLIPHTLHLHW